MQSLSSSTAFCDKRRKISPRGLPTIGRRWHRGSPNSSLLNRCSSLDLQASAGSPDKIQGLSEPTRRAGLLPAIQRCLQGQRWIPGPIPSGCSTARSHSCHCWSPNTLIGTASLIYVTTFAKIAPPGSCFTNEAPHFNKGPAFDSAEVQARVQNAPNPTPDPLLSCSYQSLL